jgi:phosphohistidine phosphatase SixA
MKLLSPRIIVSTVLVLLAFAVPALCAEDAGTIFIVRHGEKASSAADALLSPAGHQRANCLAQTLKDANVQAIFTPEVKRTQQMAEPLAHARNLPISVILRKNQPELAQKARAAAQNGDVLVVAQQDTIAPIVQQLGGGSIPPIGDNEFDRLIVLHLNASGSSVTTLRYCDCGARANPPLQRTDQGMAPPR